MADKSISELVAAGSIGATDLFVLQQDNTAKKLPGQVLLNWLTAAADGHGGIQSINKLSTSGMADTYRITLADTTVFDFVVTNGRGISSLQKTGTSGLVDTYTFTYNDGTKTTIKVTNGEKGEKGDNAYIWVKYASQEPTAQSHSFGDIPDTWIGLYIGTASAAPTDWQAYTWYQWKGEKGDTGDAARRLSVTYAYQVGDTGNVIPSGTWLATIPNVPQGKFLWIRKTTAWNVGDPDVDYSVSRMGLDGSGSVSSVANISPDENGNVPLTAEDVGALPNTGGDMSGAINMNGQPIRGLNVPTENDQAANMGFVNQQMQKAAPYNYAHNSDFTQFVAQAGVGKKHGKETYAGDRWILESGTVTGDARDDGDGYQNIKLNGTIRQIVANAPDVGYVAIDMISGTADISYNNGVITITSSGGVIKNVLLCTTETLPKYQSKGYGAELAECQRYYLHFKSAMFCGIAFVTGSTTMRVAVPTPSTMRVIPDIVTDSENFTLSVRINGTTARSTAWTCDSCDVNTVRITLTGEGYEVSTVGVCYPTGSFGLSADLPNM